MQEKFDFIGILNRDGSDIKLAGYPAHSKIRLSGPSLIFKSHHILKTISRAYLISKTGSGSKKTTGSKTLSFIITNKICNPQTGSKTRYTTRLSQWWRNYFKLQRMRVQTPPILKCIDSNMIVLIDLFIWKMIRNKKYHLLKIRIRLSLISLNLLSKNFPSHRWKIWFQSLIILFNFLKLE